jgi:hypothetical protein
MNLMRGASTAKLGQASSLRRWLVVAALLGGGWLASSGGVPLYDGVHFPQDPYRYTTPKPGEPAAKAAKATVPLVEGRNVGGVVLNTGETGPQVQLYLPPQSLLARGGGVTVAEVTVTPVELDGSTTPDAPASNVYRVASSNGVTLAVPRTPVQVTLRAAVHKTVPDMYYRSGPTDRWQRLRTRGLGHDSFNATVPDFGDFVLVRGAGGGGVGDKRIVVVVGLLLVTSLLTSALLVARRRREAAEVGS